MNVLIVGSGGREHALAWKVAQSPRLTRLYVAPGNAGTAQLAQNVPIQAEDSSALVAFAREQKIGLVLVGPETPLAAGLADDLRAAGVRVFGPSRAAARVESSKSFAKAFMQRHDIPTARYAAFGDFHQACGYLRQVDHPIVIKASGLAAGKGVILPESAARAEVALRQIMLEREFGVAGDEVVIEERLQGEEISLLAFTDGVTVKPMPPAQDHKRLLDGDHGPNTGGMGAYAPSPICLPALVAELTRNVLQPAVDGLRAEGHYFIGALYAGLMLTANGPRVLEFNCRFGDPETQALLPLLDSDLLGIAAACADGCLADIEITWKPGAAACVVLASDGYPGKYRMGHEIRGLDSTTQDTAVFHAGTKTIDGKIVTAGGRVLGVTGWGATLPAALAHAYAAVGRITFAGMQYRQDIGQRARRFIQ
jgi:phosphoribosylamine--glycine ligase